MVLHATWYPYIPVGFCKGYTVDIPPMFVAEYQHGAWGIKLGEKATELNTLTVMFQGSVFMH